MKQIIEVRNLKKSYNGHNAVCGIDFHINKGQIFALLGPNGAGKSTVINILCTYLSADEGQITIDGLSLGKQDREIQKRIGIVFQNGVLDDLLTVEENLYLRGRFYGLGGTLLHERIGETAKMTGISSILKQPYGNLSGGQRRRCDIARALLPMPLILFLDEPTTGLDPEIRSSLWETLISVKNKTGMTILMTTHYMEEATRADYISILNNGKIVAHGTPSILKEQFSGNQLILFSSQKYSLQSVLEKNRITYHFSSNRFLIPLIQTLDALPLLNLCRGKYNSFEVLRGSMEDAYLSIIEGGRGHA